VSGGGVPAAIALGSNLGDRERHVADALARIAAIAGVALLRCSRLRETEPVGGPKQGRFLNGVVLVETTRTPRELLAELLATERAGGRVRREKDGPRTIDLDLLFHGDTRCDEGDLVLPHPRLHLRDFVLEPLAEVAPHWRHPGRHPALGRTASELLRRLETRELAS